MPNKREIITIIQNIGLWDKKSIDSALEEMERTGNPLKEIFQTRGLLPYGEISPTLFFQLGIILQELPAREIPKEIIELINPSMAKKYQIVPWEIRENGNLVFVSEDPLNILASDYFKKELNWEKDIEFIITFSKEINQLISKYYTMEGFISSIISLGISLAGSSCKIIPS